MFFEENQAKQPLGVVRVYASTQTIRDNVQRELVRLVGVMLALNVLVTLAVLVAFEEWGWEPLQRVLARGCWTPVEQFGSDAGWQAGTAAADGSFDVLLNGELLGRVQWEVPGEHNRLNAVAAIAAARHVGVTPAVAIDALSRFKSVKRRMEVKGIVRGVTVYDDFAHHPTAITTTIAGLRHKVGRNSRILAVLEPRSNTMKLGVHRHELAESLTAADQVMLLQPAEIKWSLADTVAPRLGGKASVYTDVNTLAAALVAAAKPGDHLLIMSNGSFGGLHDKVLKLLAERAATPV